MTREHEITIASCAYGSRGSSIDFEAGARWADNNPKSRWISVKDDLPCNHKGLLRFDGSSTKPVCVIDNEGVFGIVNMVKTTNGIIGIDPYWKWQCGVIYYWMPIPEPPKE